MPDTDIKKLVQNYNVTNNSHVPYDFFTRQTKTRVRIPSGETLTIALEPGQVEKLSAVPTLIFADAPAGTMPTRADRPKPVVSVREVGQRRFAIYDDNVRRPEAYGTREEADAKAKAPMQAKQPTALDAAKAKAASGIGEPQLKPVP